MAWIDDAVRAGATQKRACEVAGFTARTLERWQRSDTGEDQRRGPTEVPSHALTAPERERIVQLANSAELRELPAEQVIVRLADRGIYVCSERTLDRILHEEKQHAHRERARPATHNKPREYVANGPCQVMTWDITYVPGPVRGQFFYLYLFLDVWSRRVLGWQLRTTEESASAAELLHRICKEHGVEADAVLHADNGAAMKGSTMLATMQWLGLRASFSRPGVSDDNAHVEALFRTLKYRPGYPARGFESIEQARQWMASFVRWYNEEHLHSAIGFVTPNDRHTGRDIAILEKRKAVYEAARQRTPRRWSGATRCWHRPRVALLNPERATRLKEQRERTAA